MAQKGVITGEKARVALKEGVDLMADVLRVTIGPTAGTVAIDPVVKGKAPEILDDGATIARRIVQLKGRYHNAGAMLIRHLAWRVREEVGDGSATAAVIAQSALNEATRLIAAGANPQILRKGMERAVIAAVEAMKVQAKPLETREQMNGLAKVAAKDDKIGEIIGEMLEIVGNEGVLLVEEHPATYIDRVYVEGMQWGEGYTSPKFVNNTDRMECTLASPLALVTTNRLSKASDVQPIMERCLEAGEKTLCIFCNGIEGEALALMATNAEKGTMNLLALSGPHYGDTRIGILEDIGLLTGARVFREDAGESTSEATLKDLGRAARIWCNQYNFAILGGAGDQIPIRKRVAELKQLLKTFDTEYDITKTRERIGKLSGGVAILKVGAATKAEIEEKRMQGERAIAATRAAIEEGVVPGGGVVYINAIPAVEKLLDEPSNYEGKMREDERMGIQLIARVLEMPLRAIAHNAGYDSKQIAWKVRHAEPGCGFDAIAGEIVNMEEAGILDPLKTVRTAFEAGISGAIMMMTTEVIIAGKVREPEKMTP